MPNDETTNQVQDPAARAARDPALAQAEADVERSRSRVAQSVNALREEVARRTDWREWFRRRPTTCLIAAVAVGFLLGHRRGDAAANSNTWRRRSWR